MGSEHADPGFEPPSGKPASPKAGWRGGSKSAAVPAYRWQKDWTRRPDDDYRARVRRHRFKIAGWSLLAVTLVAVVTGLLLFFPKKTPLVAVVLTDYAWPMPPNAWAREDIEGLSALDQRTLA